MSKLNETYGETPFSLIEVNGAFHIATPLTLLSQQVSLDAAYLGSTNRFVRGIPVRQWLVCVKSFGTLESLEITISYSGETLQQQKIRNFLNFLLFELYFN